MEDIDRMINKFRTEIEKAELENERMKGVLKKIERKEGMEKEKKK